jgi:hypothetical protein
MAAVAVAKLAAATRAVRVFVIKASLGGQNTVQVSHRYFGAIKNIIQQAASIGRLLCRAWSGRMRSAP